MTYSSYQPPNIPNHEHEMVLNRLLLGFSATLIVVFFAYNFAIICYFAAYLAANAALYILMRSHTGQDQRRWVAAIFLDVGMTIVIALEAPDIMSYFYPLMLWMILGNGFRLGIKYLILSSILSAVSFGYMVFSTEYWADKRGLGYSLTFALLAIPAYCSTLIHKLSKAKEAAEAASRAKSYFLTSVSHELRTPLNAIIGYGNHLQQQNLPKNQKDMIDASVLAGEHLLHLIEQLINNAKSETTTVAAENKKMRPTDLLSEIRSIMAVRANDKGLDLHLYAAALSDRAVIMPVEMIRNILLNLVGNAIKFTESGNVVVSSRLLRHNSRDMLEFQVTDTGIGIAKEACEHIFKPFQQADQTVMNRFGGTGLGLAICRQLCDQINGAIEVDSELGMGSCFTVRIPVKIAEELDAEDGVSQDAITRLLAIGSFSSDLLEKAQSTSNFVVRTIVCNESANIIGKLQGIDLNDFDVAMIDQELAVKIDPDDALWQYFAEAQIAPVLVATNKDIDLDEIWLRAAFASIIPPSPNFDELRSAVRIGCSFTRNAGLREQEAIQEPLAYTSRSILVADDNRTNRHILSAILETAGHQVTLVCDGDETIEALEKGGFDIVLLDVNMPRLNGIDASRMWRQIEGSRSHIPILGVTADATSETEQRCLDAGMDERLTKPVNAKILLETIQRHCHNADAPAVLPQKLDDPLNIVTSINSEPKVSNDTVIDQAQIKYLRDIGDDQFVCDMINGFRCDIEESFDDLETSIRQADPAQFRFASHAIKSCSNNIGARMLASLCTRFEQISEHEFHAKGAEYLVRVKTEISAVMQALDGIEKTANVLPDVKSA
jgi:two-component system, sensor histidine kinase RpfC